MIDNNVFGVGVVVVVLIVGIFYSKNCVVVVIDEFVEWGFM